MELAFDITQIVLAIVMIFAVLLQQRGSGLGAGFGGDSAVYTTKRGAEKILFNVTIVVGIVFFTLSLIRVIVLA